VAVAWLAWLGASPPARGDDWSTTLERMRSERKWNSSPCTYMCHRDPQPTSEDAEREHKKMKTEGATCIDCHQNLVHEEVPEEDLVQGKKEGRIVLKEVVEEEEEEVEEVEEVEEED